MIRSAIGRIQTQLGRFPSSVRAAIKLRNQCNAVIGAHLNGGGGTGEHAFMLQVAPHMRRFVDVGANIGKWSQRFLTASPEARGLALEPSPSAWVELQKRFAADQRITMLPIAAADKKGMAIFFAEAGAGETSSLKTPSANAAPTHPVEVQTDTLDNILRDHEWDGADYVKIDVEGFDLHVIRGMEGCLKRQAVRVVQFEYTHGWSEVGSTLGEALFRLGHFGYRVFLLRHTGLHEFPYARYGEYGCFSNFVALTQDALDASCIIIKGCPDPTAFRP